MKSRIFFPSLVLVVLVIMIIVSLGYSYKAKLFPLLICIPFAALAAGLILQEVRAKVRQGEVHKEKDITGKDTLAKYLRAPVSVIALLLLIYLLGYIVGTALFALLYLKLHGERWLTTVICVLVVIAVVYGAFTLGFGIPLYKGLLFS